jgi:hypothetical protein
MASLLRVHGPLLRGVELADCRFTPEVQRELQLTSEQAPKVTKVFADLVPLRTKIEQSREKRDEIRKAGADGQQVDSLTKQLISLEDQCRDRSHQMLKPLLTDTQFRKLLEMEEVHHTRVRERNSGGQPGTR